MKKIKLFFSKFWVILLVILGALIGILRTCKHNKKDKNPMDKIRKKMQEEIERVDVEIKIKKAKKMAKSRIKMEILEQIERIKDRKEKRKRLADFLKDL